jgi:thiamine-phosphate pyrophosphorylase
MKLILMTGSRTKDKELEMIEKMFDFGLPNLHIKKPKLNKDQMREYLEFIPEKYHDRIVLHSHHSLLWDFKLKGIHVSKRRRSKKFKFGLTKALLKFRRGNFIIGTSCKSLSSMDENYPNFDYVMLSPVFTNPYGHRPSFNKATLKRIIPSYPGKIIARGGARLEAGSIEVALELGFAGIAFYQQIWKSTNPDEEFKKIFERFKELGIEIE